MIYPKFYISNQNTYGLDKKPNSTYILGSLVTGHVVARTKDFSFKCNHHLALSHIIYEIVTHS